MSTTPEVESETSDRKRLREQFLAIRTPRQVADVLGIPYRTLIFNIRHRRPEIRYREFLIPKRSGGHRRISAPQPALKRLQRTLMKALSAVYRPKPSAHGFIPGRSVLSNANSHANRRHILNLDLVDFFPTIHFGRVRGLFIGKPFGLPADVATLLAQICCNANHLPQGAPTSPIISNLICAQMDSQLQRLAKQHKCTYTRYADDLSFSTNLVRFPPSLALVTASSSEFTVTVGEDLAGIISSNGFTINAQKVHYYDRHHRQQVTGLTVNEFPNPPRHFIRQIHAMLHAWERHGVDAAQAEFLEKYDRRHRQRVSNECFRRVVRGKISYLGMTRGTQDRLYLKLLKSYCTLANVPFIATGGYAAALPREIQAAIWILECSETGLQGTAFLLAGYGLVTCDHVIGKKSVAFRPRDPGRRFPVAVIHRWKIPDLAVLSLDAGDQPQLQIGSSDHIQPLDAVTILGYPQYFRGDSLSITQPRVSGEKVYCGDRLLRVDGGISKGCSGGPVLGSDHRVVGIAATASDALEPDPEAIYGIIPVAALKRAWSRAQKQVLPGPH